jgi:uncharacterized membrane protein
LDKKRRTIVKAITFRLLATLTTMVVVFLITGDFALANIVGGIDLISKLLLYYFHERAWEKIRWGKK